MNSPTGGVRVLPPEELLVERARDYLAAGPATSSELVDRVLQSPGVPAVVADHLARTLLLAHREFTLGSDGRWRLAAAPATHAASPEPLDALSYVVVDVETTGGRATGGDRVTEIAAVVVERGQVVERFDTLVNPGRSIPPWITSITNITWDMVRDAPRFSDVCERVTSMLDGRVFVAHNASFDWGFVSAEVERASGQRLEGRRLCTVRLARKILPQLPRRSLDHVTRHYGIEIEARHRAAGDAIATAEVLRRLLRDAADRGCTTWDQLEGLLAGGTGAARRRRRSALPAPVRGAEDGR
ncbi:MAG TPA: exonuclease domain-containing protein [Gemmatimonadales bacterium]